MALLKLTSIKSGKILEAIKPSFAIFLRNNSENKQSTPPIGQPASDDMPVKMENPFFEEKPQCILCKYDIEPNYKNVRLLSQFISRYTGKVYGRYITGLCKAKQKAVEKEIKRAQSSGLMGVYAKDKNFLADPVLYDSSKPFRVL